MKIITNPPISRWEEYKALRLEAVEKVPQSFLDDLDVAEKIPKEEWQRKISSMLFVEVDGKLVGMIGSYRDEKTKLKHILNIFSFYVSSEYRGLGIGKALLQKVIETAKKNPEIKKLQLGVVTSQEPANVLYRSLGFVQAGHMKYAIKVGDIYFDEYHMELYL